MNFRQMKLRILFAALLICCAPLAFSQTLTTGDVTGTITDATGAIVPGAAVTLKNVDTNEARTAVTNETGRYRFSLLVPGDYTVSAQSTGLKSNTDKITVGVGQEQAVNLTLNVQGTQEVVEVKAEGAVIQTENANLATEVSHAQIVNLPMNGGDLTTVAFTVPGVRMNVGGGSGNFNANGIPMTSVLFTINGADVMDPYNNLNNSGASNNLLGANEVAEAAVVLNAYSPQYGRMAAAQVNIVGKAGRTASMETRSTTTTTRSSTPIRFSITAPGLPSRVRMPTCTPHRPEGPSERTRRSSSSIPRPCATRCQPPPSQPSRHRNWSNMRWPMLPLPQSRSTRTRSSSGITLPASIARFRLRTVAPRCRTRTTTSVAVPTPSPRARPRTRS